MARNAIKDKSNRTIGYIEEMGGGKQKAVNASNRTLGYYDPKANKTTDASNRTIATGNVLSGLVFDQR